MKSYNNLWNKFISFENLYKAYKKARKSNPHKKHILKFSINLEEELFTLQKLLINKTYKISPYRYFKISEPKERLITAPCFKDLVVQHAIINLIEPIFDNTFISNSFACRKNKGTHKGVKQIMKLIINDHYPKYYLKQDVKKYFPNVDKNILKKIIQKRIKDKQLLSVIFQIIDSYCYENNINKGIPIGNLTSQLFANIYLNELDQYVKHKLKIKYYYRYVDDFLIFSDSKKDLKIYKRKIKLFLNKTLFLEVPNHKKYTNLTKNGVDFLGYKIFPKYLRIRKSNIKRFLRRTKNNLKLYHLNKITLEKNEASVYSFLGYIKLLKTNSLY